jgi:hypothetical protein
VYEGDHADALSSRADEPWVFNQMSSLQEKISTAILTRIRKRRNSLPATERNQHGSSPMLAPAKLREATFSDFDGVSKLKDRSGIVADSLENWNRLWRHNPVLAQSKVKRPIGWVLDADGEIVGYLGNISLQCRYGEKTLSAVATHAFAVDSAYRAVALTLAAAFYRQKFADLYISAHAIEATGKIALAFKGAALPQRDYDTVLFWVLRPYPFAKALMRKLNLNQLVSLVGSIFAAVTIAADKIVRRRWPKRSADPISVCEIRTNDIGNDFETLWAEKLKESSRLFTYRTPAALRWHFEIPGDRGSARVLCCHKNGKLTGYAVIRTDTDPQDGLQKSIVADMLVTKDDPALVQGLLAAAYGHAKLIGSHILEVQGFPSDIRAVCSDWRPYRRKFAACPYYYKAADPVLHKSLGNPEAWYACPFDGDATLIRPSFSNSAEHVTSEEQKEDTRTNTGSDVPESEETRVF